MTRWRSYQSSLHSSNQTSTDIHSWETAACVLAERSLLRTLEGGCQVPVAATTRIESHDAAGASIRLTGRVLNLDGTKCLESEAVAVVLEDSQADALGRQVAAMLIEQGAAQILHEVLAASSVPRASE